MLCHLLFMILGDGMMTSTGDKLALLKWGPLRQPLAPVVPSQLQPQCLRICIMTSIHSSKSNNEDAELPSWLAHHLKIEWNSDDVDALLTSIDASQRPTACTSPVLPAELLLLVLEYVPPEYLLDWRLICRGFRDAIDGRILFQLLQRTRLIGYLGSRTSANMTTLSDEAYEQLHLLHADYRRVEHESWGIDQQRQRAMWGNSHAVFTFSQQWADTHILHENNEGIPSQPVLQSRLHLSRNDQAYGALTWAIQLDTCVLDLDFPLEAGREAFDVTIDVERGVLRIEWKPMLFRFLKTERALRLLMENKNHSRFTFSHAEDCLRAVRRQRLHAALDPENKIDRHIKWSLRLLRPLWGVSGHRDPSTLDPVERDAVRVLLLLRRTAALDPRQIAYLEQLAEDYRLVVKSVNGLARSVQDVQSQLVRGGQQDIMYCDTPQAHLDKHRIPVNPIAWPDKLRADVELRVQKWKAQQSVIEQMQALMIISQEALAVPEDAFDSLDSEF